jgi:hypothetical protein
MHDKAIDLLNKPEYLRKHKLKPSTWAKAGDYLLWHGDFYKIASSRQFGEFELQNLKTKQKRFTRSKYEFLVGYPQVFEEVPKMLKLLYLKGCR